MEQFTRLASCILMFSTLGLRDINVHGKNMFNATIFNVKIATTRITTAKPLEEDINVYPMLDPKCNEVLQLLETVYIPLRQNVLGCRNNRVEIEGYWLFSIYVDASKLQLESANEQLCTQDSLAAMIVKWKRKTSVRFSVPLENIDITMNSSKAIVQSERFYGYINKGGRKVLGSEGWPIERVKAVRTLLQQWFVEKYMKYPVIRVIVTESKGFYLYANVYQMFDVSVIGQINFNNYLEEIREWVAQYNQPVTLSDLGKDADKLSEGDENMFPVCKMMAVPHRGMKDFKLIEVNVLEVKMKISEERLQSKTATAHDVYAIMEPTGKKVFNFIEKISKEFSKQVYGYKSKKTEAGIIVTSVYVPVLDFAYKTKGEKRCFTESLSELLHSWTTAGIEHFQLKDDELSIYVKAEKHYLQKIEVKAALFENGGWITIFKSWDEPRLSGTAAFLSEFLLHSSVVQVQTHPTKVGKLGMDVYFTFDVTTSNGVLPIDVYYLTKDLEQWSKMDFRSIKLYDFSGRVIGFDNKEVPFPVCINVPEPDESVHVFNATVFSVKITATEITTMTILSDKMDVYSMLDPYCYEMLQLLETVHMQFRQNVMGCRTNQVKTEGYWLFSIYVNESKLHLENANEQLCTQDSLTAMIVKWKRKTSVRFSVPLENIDITMRGLPANVQSEKIVGFLTKKGQKFEKNEQWTSERVAAVNKFLLQWSNGTKTKYPVIHVTVNTESLKYLYANVYQVFDVTQTGPINFDEYLKDLRAWANKYSEALKISGFRKEADKRSVENIKMFTICEQMAVPDAGKNTFKLIETNVIEMKMKQPTEIIHTANTADGELWGKLEPIGRTILSFVPSISSEFAKHIYGYKTQQTASGSLKIWFYIPAFASVYKTNGSINCSDRSLSKLLHHWKSVTVRHFNLQEHELTISATTKKRHLQRLFVNTILSEKIGSVISHEDWEASGANEVTTFLSPFLSDPLSDYTFVKVETTPENYNYLRMEMYVTLDVTAPNGALPVAIESFGQDLRKWSEMYQGAIKLADFKGEIEGLDRDPEEIFPECLFVSQMAEVDSQDLDSDRTGNPYLNPGGLKLLPPSEVNDAALIEKDSTDGNAGWRLVNHFQTPLFTLFSMSMTMLIVLN